MSSECANECANLGGTRVSARAAHARRARVDARGAVGAGGGGDQEAGDDDECGVVSRPLVLRLCGRGERASAEPRTDSAAPQACRQRTFVVRRVAVAAARAGTPPASDGMHVVARAASRGAHAHNGGRDTQIQHLPERELEVHLPPLAQAGGAARRSVPKRGARRSPCARLQHAAQVLRQVVEAAASGRRPRLRRRVRRGHGGGAACGATARAACAVACERTSAWQTAPVRCATAHACAA